MCYSYVVSLSFLHPGPASTVCWRLALWVGGSCMRGTLWAACCWLFSPLNLCSFSPHSLYFSFFLPLFSQFLRWRKNLRCGLFVLVWCRFSHVLGRISYLHDSSLDCEGLSWYHVHVCVRLAVHTEADAARLASSTENVYSCIMCVWYSPSLLVLEQQSAWLPVHFPATALWSPASRDSSFPSPPFSLTSCVCLVYVPPRIKKKHANLVGRSVKPTTQLVIWEKWMREFEKRGGLGRRRGLCERQSGSWAVSIWLFLLILNCSHWKTVTSS